MTKLIAIDPSALDALFAEVRALREEISAVRIAPQPEWVTIPEAARQLGVSPDTIRRRIRTGELKARGRGKTRQVRL